MWVVIIDSSQSCIVCFSYFCVRHFESYWFGRRRIRSLSRGSSHWFNVFNLGLVLFTLSAAYHYNDDNNDRHDDCIKAYYNHLHLIWFWWIISFSFSFVFCLLCHFSLLCLCQCSCFRWTGFFRTGTSTSFRFRLSASPRKIRPLTCFLQIHTILIKSDNTHGVNSCYTRTNQTIKRHGLIIEFEFFVQIAYCWRSCNFEVSNLRYKA